MPPPDPADPADPTTTLTACNAWNSFQINHQFCSWHHPSTGTPQSNMMISSCFINQWKVGSPFRIFQWRHQQIPLQNPTPLNWSMCSIFLGNTGCWKFDHWKPTGTADEIAKKKKQATAFMDYLSSMMDHTVSQCCRIYQLEDVHILPGESPDELIQPSPSSCWLIQLPDRRGEGTECPVQIHQSPQWQGTHQEALDLTATTPKMLEVCHTNTSPSQTTSKAMGLKEQKTVNVIWRQNKPHQGKKPPADSVHSCGHCMKSHPPGRSSCPARDDKYWGCWKLGHWKPKCWSGPKGPKDKGPKHHNRGWKQRKVNEVGTDEDPYCDEVGVVAVVLQTPSHREWLTTRHRRSDADPETIEISDVWIDSTTEAFATVQMPAEIRPNQLVTLKCKVDTGVGCNVMPLCTFSKLFPRHINANGSPRGLKSSMMHLTAYNRSKIPQFGTLDTAIDWTPNGKDVANCLQTWWYIADTLGPAILGLPSCAKLGIVELNCAVNLQKRKLVQQKKPTTEGRKVKQDLQHLKSPPLNTNKDLIQAYLDRFEGIAHFPGTYHITLYSDAKPIVHAPWKCPIAMQPLVWEKLDEFLEQGIVVPVEEPTDWISSLAYSWKAHGKLRVCLDPRDVNKAIKRDHYKTPTVEEITHLLAGSKKFTKTDGTSSYLCIVLNYESSHLTTFNTPWGRYRFVCLPWGLSCAQNIFQQDDGPDPGMLQRSYWNCQWCCHLWRWWWRPQPEPTQLHVQSPWTHGLVFNGEKCKVKKDSVTFFGTVYDANGAHSDPKKVDAIHKMPPPGNKLQLQHFLGMVTYLSPFFSSLSTHTAPLWDLLEKDSEFM